MEDTIIGIDLGTTFSAVGYVRSQVPEILPKGNERIIPSVVGFSPEGKLIVGMPARNQYVLYPERTVRSIKRKMGSDEKVTLNGRAYSPPEISAIILRELKRIAETNLGQPVNRAVITVPAYFSDAARQATKDAGEIAGFKVERIINEPTAAALAYGLDRLDEQMLAAVYDLGGGTFDVSIIELNQGVIEVRASHGNTQLGGDDFDLLLMNHLAERFEEEHGVDPRADRRAKARLLQAAERAKIELSSRPFVKIKEEYLVEQAGTPRHLVTEVSRQEFEDLTRPLIDKTITAFDQALKDAELTKKDLDRIIFVGGSTRIPLVWERVSNHIGLEPQVEINPDEAVALGAGVQAAIIAGKPLDTILVDVTPHSLGIEVAEWRLGRIVGDRYGVIIRRNTPLPTSKSEVFFAMYPEQTQIMVKVYQGESSIASHNTFLGDFEFDRLKAEKPGELPSIMVQFDLDLNGILQVRTVDRASGRKYETTMQAAHVRMNVTDKAAASHLIQQAEETLDETPVFIARAESVLESARQRGETSEELARLQEIHDQLQKISADPDAEEDQSLLLMEEMIDLLYFLEEDDELEDEEFLEDMEEDDSQA